MSGCNGNTGFGRSRCRGLELLKDLKLLIESFPRNVRMIVQPELRITAHKRWQSTVMTGE